MPTAAPDAAPLDEDGPAGQPDAAEDHEEHRQHDAEQGVRVLQRVQREVALGADRDVPAVQRRTGVRVLVEAERDHPGAGHEEEDGEPRRRDTRPHAPPGYGRHGRDREEDRADAPVGGADGGGGGRRHAALLLGGPAAEASGRPTVRAASRRGERRRPDTGGGVGPAPGPHGRAGAWAGPAGCGTGTARHRRGDTGAGRRHRISGRCAPPPGRHRPRPRRRTPWWPPS